MAYEKQTFADNNVLHAHHLNHMEAGIEKNSEDIEVNAFNIGVLNTVDLTAEGDKLFLKTALGKIGEGVSLGGAIEKANKYTDEKIASLVDSAPETLDTLNEIAVALKDNQNVASALTKEIGQKATQADLDNVSGDVETLAGEVDAVADRLDGVSNQLGQYATKTELSAKANQTEVDGLNQAMDSVVENFAQAFSRISDLEETAEGLHEVATSGSYNDLTDKPSIPSVAGLASTTYVDTKVATKANQTDVDGINQSLDLVAENIGAIYTQLEGKATTTYVDTKIADLVGAAPEELDTLKELSDALHGDDDFAENVLNKIGQKADKSVVEALDKDMDEVVKEIAEVYTELSKKANDADIKTVAKTGSYNDLKDKPTIPSISGLATTSYVDTKVAGKADQTEIGYINQALDSIAENTADIYTQLGNKADQSDYDQLHQMYNDAYTELGKKANDADLKTVAKTGSYNDLTNKPTIPAAVTVDSALSSTSTNPVQNKVINSALAGKANANDSVSLAGVQTISGNKTYTGQNTFTNGLFAIKARSATDDSWINLTNSSNGAYYAFGIRRPYANYGLQMKYHPDASNQDASRPGDANGTADIYYDIYHQGNYWRIPTATTSVAGLMSAADKIKVNGLASVATSGSYNDLSNKPTIPTTTSQLANNSGFATETYVNNKVAGIVDSSPEALNTLNELAAALGDNPNFSKDVLTLIGQKATQADLDALSGDVENLTTEVGKKANTSSLHKVATSGSYNDLTNKPTIPTVNNATLTIQKNGSNIATFTANSSSNATANITVPTNTSELINDSNYATTTQLATKLDKTTYEESKELALGSNGKVCLGKFGAYDTNITIELNSTTNNTYHATIVIHSQNVVANGTGGTVGCYVYDDADNHITPLISVFRPYGSASRQIEVYADLPGWSKNLVHVQGVAISTGGMTEVLTSVSSIPTAIDGKIKVTPVNVLTTNFASKTEINAKADQADVDQLYDTVADINTALGKKADASAIPTKTSQLTNDSGFKTTDNNTTYSLSKNGSTITLTGSDGSTSSVTDSNSTSYLPLSGGSMNSDATIKLTTYGTRHLILSGNAISADMSNETGGWAGNFASVKAPGGVTTTMLGWYGGASGLTHIFMGGTYSDPAMKMTPAGQFTFKSTPKVGSSNVALESSLSNYVTNAKLEEVLGSYVNDIDALLGG